MAINDPRIPQIMESFDMALEACAFLASNGAENNAFLLTDLRELCLRLEKTVAAVMPRILIPNKLREIGKNAAPVIDNILQTAEKADWATVELQIRCSLMPLLTFWQMYAEFLLETGGSEQDLAESHRREREYLRELRKQPKRDEPREYRFDFSVVILFYNNQEITNNCLESVAACCKGYSYELITVNNGSDAQTTAWSETLPHEKKIYYPHNIGSSAAGNLIFSTAYQFVEGKYLLYLSNDVVLTEGCIESLIKCMDSDERIAQACPVVSSASNLQSIPVPYKNHDLQAIQRFGKTYNQLNPGKWYERSLVFTILGCMRPEALHQLGLNMSPVFCYDMFADDDFGCKLRRAGYRQVLCKDVFAHHYGSATIKEDQFAVMGQGRAQFYKKHGVDAWLARGLECQGLGDRASAPQGKDIHILGINPHFGESVLNLRNRMREQGCTSVWVDTVSEDERYLDDMQGLFDTGFSVDDPQFASLDRSYDFVLVEDWLEACKDVQNILRLVSCRLKPQGVLLCKVRNMRYWNTIQKIICEDGLESGWTHDPGLSPDVRFLPMHVLEALLERNGLVVASQVRVVNGEDHGLSAQMARVVTKKEQEQAALKQAMTVAELWLTIKKKAQ